MRTLFRMLWIVTEGLLLMVLLGRAPRPPIDPPRPRW